MKIFGRYHALLKTSCLREDTVERRHIKCRKGEKNDPFQDQYDHRLRSLLAPYYGTEQYRRITSRAFTCKYGGVTERFSSVNGRNCLANLSNTAVNGPVTDGVLVDLGIERINHSYSRTNISSKKTNGLDKKFFFVITVLLFKFQIEILIKNISYVPLIPFQCEKFNHQSKIEAEMNRTLMKIQERWNQSNCYSEY